MMSALPVSIPQMNVQAASNVIYKGVNGLPFENGDPCKGVDISSVISLENSGIRFFDKNGQEQDIFRTIADAGVNTVRVRIWNDPYQSGTHANYGGGICDADIAVQIAERCAKAGLSLMADFHYSDFWADPGKQNAPKAWKQYSLQQKADAIYQYTQQTLERIGKTGVNVAMVQVGNETTTGMCGVSLADYNWSDQGWKDLTALFNAGAKAVREFNPETLVVLHFTNPEKTSNMNYIAKMLYQSGADYDVFATSYYPYWHGTLSNLTNVLSSVAGVYHKKVMVAETSWLYRFEDSDDYPNTISSRDSMGDYVSYEVSPAGQTAFLHDVFQAVANVPDGMGIGVCYWEAAWLGVGSNFEQNRAVWEQYGSGWANASAGEYDDSARKYYGGTSVDNQALFDQNGKPLDSLYVFSTIHGNGAPPAVHGENLLQNPGFEANGGWSANPTGWQLHATADSHFDVRAEDSRSGGYALHWYSEKAFSDSTAQTSVKTKKAGTYRCYMHIQGDEQSSYELTVESSSGERKDISGTGSGWANWELPEAEIEVGAGETITMTLRVSGAAGSYGSADDCGIEWTEKPAKQDDLNGDGVLDGKDAALLMEYLLSKGTLTAQQAASADRSKDGKLTAADLTLLKRSIFQS